MIITKALLREKTGVDYYDGNIIHSRFAYNFLGEKISATGDCLVYHAPMEVKAEGMIDNEDLNKKDFIYSADAINVVWEIPNLCQFGAVAFQRLFNTQIAATLSNNYLKKPIEVDGDDIMVHAEHDQGGIIQKVGKCSVSITHCVQNAAIGHTGINVLAGRHAPAFAFSTKLTDNQIASFMMDIDNIFYGLTEDIFVATAKIRKL